MSEEYQELTMKDIDEEMEKLLAHGFGRLVIDVTEHRIAQIEASTRRRQTSRAGKQTA
jgi:hypothetical protein